MSLSRDEHEKLRRALELEEIDPQAFSPEIYEHLRNCRQCNRLVQNSQRLRKLLVPYLISLHPTTEELLAHLTGTSLPPENSAELSTTPARSHSDIALHLENCNLCRARRDYFREELRQMESLMVQAALTSNFEREYVPEAEPRLRPLSFGKVWPNTVSVLMIAIMLVCALLISVFALSLSTQPPAYALANLNTDDFAHYSPLRGEGDEDEPQGTLLAAEEALRAGEYEQVGLLLAPLKREKLSEHAQLRAQLCNFMATLKLAHKSTFNFFPHFDTTSVTAAILTMEGTLATLQSDTDDFPSLNRGLAYYYLAKAYLMLNRPEPACKYLTRATSLPHRRRAQAMELQAALGAQTMPRQN